MKRTRSCVGFLILNLTLLGLFCCEFEQLPPLKPTIKTGDALTVSDSGAVIQLTYSSDFNTTQSIGVVYSDISQEPHLPLSRFVVTDDLGVNAFTLNNLDHSSTYYYRAFATDGVNYVYGDVKSFVTHAAIPTISTSSIFGISEINAISGGTILENGGSKITAKGVCWSTSLNPTVDLSSKTMNGVGDDSFRSSITGLTANTRYYIRAYATNSIGTSYGEQLSFVSELQPLAEIGDTIEGGLVFYVDDTGRHGLVCAEYDQSLSCTWSNVNLVSTFARSSSIGSGFSNTNIIVIFYGKGNYAARYCYDLVLNGYNDWYLPSKDELYMMFLNLQKRDLGNFPKKDDELDWYWSSTEEFATTAYQLRFHKKKGGYFLCYPKNSFDTRLRAVRSF